ncbi:MAG TPA: hypothetical protein VLW85_13995 [Myxococcales bacterium]|nr:hypothetical protein [Myxococcales bacterium]
MWRLLLIACCGCAPLTILGAASVTGEALLAARANRAAGGCVAVCGAGTTCNARTGFCERPGGPGEGPPGGPSDVVAGAPDNGLRIPLKPLHVDPLTSRPEIVPAAESAH